MGLYRITDQWAQLFPIYQQMGGPNYLYMGTDGVWQVSKNYRDGLPGVKLNEPTPMLLPPVYGWQYWDGSNWQTSGREDNTLTIVPTSKNLRIFKKLFLK